MTTIITPEIEPESGGVADYTIRVVEEWGQQVRVLSSRMVTSFPSLMTVEPLPTTDSEISSLLERSDRVLLQYSGYGFSQTGFPRALLTALRHWKEKQGRRLVLVLHEIWSAHPFWRPAHWRQRRHRRALGSLIRAADSVVTTTEDQARLLRQASGREDIEVLPVTSSIRRCPEPAKREEGLAVIFGRLPSRIETLRVLQREIRTLAQAAILQRIVTLGSGAEETALARERELLNSCALTGGFLQLGRVPADEASRVLSTATYALFAQPILSLTKSCTFMAYAQHSLRVIVRPDVMQQSAPSSFLIAPSELLEGLPAAQQEQRAGDLRRWQERTSSWSRIAQRLQTGLEGGSPT